MTHQPRMWSIIQERIPRGRWISLQEIYDLVERNAQLDEEDFDPQSPSSDIPKWKRNVRNVLQYRKGINEIQWDGDEHYLLT